MTCEKSHQIVRNYLSGNQHIKKGKHKQTSPQPQNSITIIMNNASENKVNTWEQHADQDQLYGLTNRLIKLDPQAVDKERFAHAPTHRPPTAVPDHYDPYPSHAGHHNFHTSYHQSGDRNHLSGPPNQLMTHPLAGVPEPFVHTPSYRPPSAILDHNDPNHLAASHSHHRYYNSHHPTTVPMSTAGISIAKEISGVTYNSHPSTLYNQGAKTVIKDNSTTTSISDIVT